MTTSTKGGGDGSLSLPKTGLGVYVGGSFKKNTPSRGQRG